MRHRLWSLLAVPFLCGCASGPNWVAQPSHLPLSGLEPRLEEADDPAPVDVIQTMMASAHRGVTASVTGTVVGATLIYPKSLATTYTIVTKLHRTTTLIFPVGERLSGDITGGKEQVRYQPYPEAEATNAPGWVISPGYSGSGAGTHLQVDITPIASNLQTTIVVRTTGGWYVLDVTSKGKGYYPMVAFYQPEASTPARRPQTVSASGPMGIGYEILTAAGQVPSWTPMAVWDTQALTIFQFSDALAQGEAPELYSVTPEGERALVNTTPQGQRLMIAHRLAGTWELKLGSAVVRVQQTPDYMVVTCPGQPGCPTTMAPHAAR
jgi:type IV secretory pathway VirB9-like protein